ncbi:MAG: superoxide dismutase [Prochloraceae cyanobacterium]|nr:superoxide dismutase [Prochloraceae cyanobacterium]
MALNRRNFIFLLGATGVVFALEELANPISAVAQNRPTSQARQIYPYTPLPYAHNALEPYIDERTMRFHHGKHYAGYTRNLNAAVAGVSELQGLDAEELIRNLDRVPKRIRRTVRNNGGGYVNHKMFWEIMSPDGGGEPRGSIAKSIRRNFGSFDRMKEDFNARAKKVFGSGWAWLVLDDRGKLRITTTSNQDTPLMEGVYPIMGIDVWEHAYYLKYQNNRGGYIENWWNVVNWDEVNRRYRRARDRA